MIDITAKIILNTKKFGPIEFFMNVMAIEMVAPEQSWMFSAGKKCS